MFSANEMRVTPRLFQNIAVLDVRSQGLRLCLMAAQIASDKKADTKDRAQRSQCVRAVDTDGAGCARSSSTAAHSAPMEDAVWEGSMPALAPPALPC
eukprot:15448324-Alexandrium_andersonii.AAC.1